jgi:hypothetical protein
MGLVPAVARWWALPAVGLAALTAEAVDAASVLARPPRELRERLSDDFVAPLPWHGQELSIHEPLVNAFGEALSGAGADVSVTMVTDLASTPAGATATHTVVRLQAAGIPADRVGVYGGRIGPSADDTIPVWLVIP